MNEVLVESGLRYLLALCVAVLVVGWVKRRRGREVVHQQSRDGSMLCGVERTERTVSSTGTRFVTCGKCKRALKEVEDAVFKEL